MIRRTGTCTGIMARSLKEVWPAPDAAHVRAAVDRLVGAFDPLKIVVFGSYIRGDSRPGSDLDLLVVLPEVFDKRETAIEMRRILADLGVPKDLIVTTPEEIDRRADSTWHIVGIALREGEIVYEKRGRDGAAT